MAWCFSFQLQALPVWSLLPVFLPAFRAEEPRSYALQRQAFQVWLLRSCLCWCHNTQQSHPDTHWGKALQVSTWSQQPLPAEVRQGNTLLLFLSITASYWHTTEVPLKAKVRPPDETISGVTNTTIKTRLGFGCLTCLEWFFPSVMRTWLF